MGGHVLCRFRTGRRHRELQSWLVASALPFVHVRARSDALSVQVVLSTNDAQETAVSCARCIE